MSIPPFNDRILLRRMPPPEQFTSSDGHSKSGIIIPKSVSEQYRPNLGVVLDIGPDVKVQVKPGDQVLYEKYAGAEVQMIGKDGVLVEDLLMVRGEDLISGFKNDGNFYEKILEPIFKEEKDRAEKEEAFKAEVALAKKEMDKAIIERADYKCWNNDCEKKGLVVNAIKGTTHICEYCGQEMSEMVLTPDVIVRGGTPTFHQRVGPT